MLQENVDVLEGGVRNTCLVVEHNLEHSFSIVIRTSLTFICPLIVSLSGLPIGPGRRLGIFDGWAQGVAYEDGGGMEIGYGVQTDTGFFAQVLM